MDNKKRIEELKQQIQKGQQQLELIKQNIYAAHGAISILEEQLKENPTKEMNIKEKDNNK